MNKKVLIQYFLFFLVVSISSIIFFIYFYDNNQNEKISNSKVEIKTNIKKSNLITDLKYVARDNEGNQYEITSKSGEVDIEDQDIIFMKDVKAVIKLIDKESIFIKSDSVSTSFLFIKSLVKPIAPPEFIKISGMYIMPLL